MRQLTDAECPAPQTSVHSGQTSRLEKRRDRGGWMNENICLNTLRVSIQTKYTELALES